MYKCKTCGEVFDDPKLIEAESFYGVSSEFDYNCGEEIEVCPHCESTDFEENKESEEQI